MTLVDMRTTVLIDKVKYPTSNHLKSIKLFEKLVKVTQKRNKLFRIRYMICPNSITIRNPFGQFSLKITSSSY